MSQPRTAKMPEYVRQMTLGEFIHALGNVQPDQRVKFDFGDIPQGETQLFDCYEPHPDELAISHRPAMRDDRMTSAEIIMMRAAAALDCTFIDQRGREHRMDENTPLWAANWREHTNNAVVALEANGNAVIIRTWRIE